MQSFSELGVSARIVRKPRRARHPGPLPDPGARPPRRTRRTRHPRQGSDGVRQDHRVRDTARRAAEPGDAHPAALVLVPTRELASQVAVEIAVARAEGRRGRDGLRRRSDPYPGEARAACPRPGCDSRSPERPPRAQGDLARRRTNPGARRGRPHARHGLQASGRPHRAAASAHPADDVLLRDSRREGRRARARVHLGSRTLRGRSEAPRTAARSSTASSP